MLLCAFNNDFKVLSENKKLFEEDDQKNYKSHNILLDLKVSKKYHVRSYASNLDTIIHNIMAVYVQVIKVRV